MNVSTLSSQTIAYSPIVLPNFAPRFGVNRLQVYSVNVQSAPGSPILSTPTIIHAPVIQQTMRSTSYPSSPLKIRNVTPTVVGVVSN